MRRIAWISAVAIAGATCAPVAALAANCTVPNAIANGQVADASKVMDNFNAVAGCADQGIKPNGTPTAGSVAVFSDPKTITAGNLTGDISTSGGTVTTLTQTGVIPGTYSSPKITIDDKGRITSAVDGYLIGSGSWSSLSFSDQKIALWGSKNYFKSNQNLSLISGNKIDVVVGFLHNQGKNIAIVISPDDNSSIVSINQDDNNWVIYRYANATSASTVISGGSFYSSISGTFELRLTIFVGKPGLQNIISSSRLGDFDRKMIGDDYSNVPLISQNVHIYIQADNDDISNISYAKYIIY